MISLLTTPYYDSIIVFTVFSIYTIILLIFYFVVKHTQERENDKYRDLERVKYLIGSAKDIVTKEDFRMAGVKEETKNELTLTDLVTQNPTEDQYEEVADILVMIAQKTYEDYKFLIMKSPDETKDANFIQIQSSQEEMPEKHKEAFSKTIDYGLDMGVLRNHFSRKVAKGGVIGLGEDAIVILDDNTQQTPTGVSPINSGVEGGEIVFNISFVQGKNYDEWASNRPQLETDSQ